VKPLLLDLFCGAGGAAKGYADAGFEVVGIDLNPQPNYPYEFHQLDAIEALARLVLGRNWPRHFDAIHASPPCQHYTDLAKGNNANQNDYPALIEPTRELLKETGLPYVIENVCGSPLLDPVMLCGEMFGVPVIRHRLFETNWPLTQPLHRKHRGRVAGYRNGQKFDGPYLAVYGNGGGKGSLADWQAGMQMPWAKTKKEIAEAIPPAYTRFIGGQLRDHLDGWVDLTHATVKGDVL
jgi:hypothetical protein